MQSGQEYGCKADLLFVIARNEYRRSQNSYDLKLIEIFVPYYKSKIFALRVIAEIYFCFAVVLVLLLIALKTLGLGKRVAIISPPAFSSLILMSAGWFGFDQRYLIQRDIYNEVWLSEKAKFYQLKHKILSNFLKLGYFFATRIGFENEADLEQQCRFSPSIQNKSEVLLNWCIAPEIFNSNSISNGGNLKLIYAGNVGIAQDPKSILQFLQTVEAATVQIDFFGSGSHFSWLQYEAEKLSLRCKFYKAISPVALEKIIQSYDAGLLFLNPERPLNNFPGKAMLYIKNDLPTVSIVHPKSYIAEVMGKHNLGVTISCPTDVEDVFSKLEKAITLSNSSPGEIAAFAKENLSTDNVYKRIFG